MALTMEEVSTSETPVYFNENARRYIPEGSSLIEINPVCVV
jgi:hypothetical protein